MKAVERVVFVAVLLMVVVIGAFHLNPIFNQEKLPFVWLVPPFALFSFLHAAYLLGWKRASVFFGVSAVLSLGSELLGTISGFPFGDYYYTDVLGPKLFSRVPLLIPVTRVVTSTCAHPLVVCLHYLTTARRSRASKGEF